MDIQVDGAMADHQPQALGRGEASKGQGLLGDGAGSWGLRGSGGGGSHRGCWHGWGQAAEVHTHHGRQPVAPGPVPVLLGSPACKGGLAQGHHGLSPQAAVGAAAPPPVYRDADGREGGENGGAPGLGPGPAALPGAHLMLELGQPLQPEG